MKNRINISAFSVLAILGVLFSSCKEQLPPGLDLGGGTKAQDSTYTAAIEAKQDRNILIEELTGVQCSNCPKAARNIKTMETDHPERIVAVALHPPSNGFTEPILNKSHYDFRSPQVDEIANILGGIQGLPSGALAREKTSNGTIFDIDYGAWTSRVVPMLAQTTPVNIHIESAYVTENNQGEVTVQVAFTENVTDDLYLTIYLVESDIVDYQDDGGVKVPDYVHNHVFRTCITNVLGDNLNLAEKKAGTVMQKRYSFNPIITGDNAWHLEHCHVVAFVHRGGATKTVVHAETIDF